MSYRIVNGRAYPVGNIGGVQVNKPINNSKSSGNSFKDVKIRQLRIMDILFQSMQQID